MKTDASVRTTISPAEGLASVYIPSLTDGFGDRLLMFDNTDTDPLEMLRFHAALLDTPGFEEAVRERVRRLERLTDSAFPTIRAVKRLESDGALVLVSTYPPGKRLSALLAESRVGRGVHPASVAWIVAQVIQPLSVLQSEGEHFAHGALTADRIILTDDGRVRIAEHVLGSALRHLNLPSSSLWREFGVLVPPGDSGIPHLNARTDVFQVGALALSMLLAQRITPADVERRLPLLLDEWSRSTITRSQPVADSLRLWIERALQIGDRSYCSAADAYGDLCRLPHASAHRAFTFLHAGNVNELALPPAALPAPEQTREQEPQPRQEQPSHTSVVTDPSADARAVSGTVAEPPAEIPAVQARPVESRPKLSTVAAREPARVPRAPHRAEPARRATSRWARHAVPMAAAFAAIAVLEAFVIVAMLLRERPPAAADAGAVPSSSSAGLVSQAGSPPEPAGAGTRVEGSRQQRRAAASAPNGRQNAGAAVAAFARAANNEGSSEVSLTAPTLGVAPLGRISVNAEPWAEVWIDNQSVGETPLAHLEVPVGEHEVIFRHPEFGERRQQVIVRADGVTRASTTFDR